jgi:hypothetical protein
MHSRVRFHTSRWLLIFLCLGAFAGCSDSSDSRDTMDLREPIMLIDLLPASTRGILQLRGQGDTDPALALQASLDGNAPWRHNTVDILRYYSAGMDLAATAEQLLLAQLTRAGDEYALLAAIGKEDGEALLDTANLADAGQYQGVTLLAVPGTALLLALLDERTWVIAPRSSLEQVIDVYLGTLPNIHTSAIANHLDSLAAAQPIAFVYGLPALYKPVVPPGSGANSLTQATVAKGAFSVSGDTLSGRLQFVSPNAQGYTQRLQGLLPESHRGAITAMDDTVAIDLTGLSAATDMRPLLKSLFIGMDTIDYNEAVMHGGNAPWMNFKVGENPNSIFINFEFTDRAARDAFAAQHLPAGFSLAPIRILATDAPRYFLVLNIYQSSGGLVEGARAEWSVFVNDPDGGEPRFLVVQAAAETISADSVNLLTLPEPVSHVLEPDAISSYVGVVDEVTKEESLYFSSHINWPQQQETLVSFHREFAAANDYIFWGNAVADRGLHNATVHNRSAVLITGKEITITDKSRWSQYIRPEPVHSVVYRNPLDIVISPWWNLDADYLDVTDEYRQTLIDFKNGFYPSTVLGLAEAAMRGVGSALGAFTDGETVPTTRYYFTVTDPAALLASVDADSGIAPVAIALHDGDTPDYYLSLVIEGRTDDPCGLRAQWSTYVLGENDRPRTLVLDTLSSDACLDPVSLLGISAVVEQRVDGDQIHTRLASPFMEFTAQLDLSRGDVVLSGLDWIEAGDSACSLGGVCDYFFYDGEILVEPVLRIAAEDVVIDKLRTPWEDYIRTRPTEVTVQHARATYATNPWKNVKAFGQ